MRGRAGFSLIEVLIVIALIVLVVAIAAPRLGNGRAVEQTGFVQNVRELADLAPSEAKSRQVDVLLSQVGAGVALSATGGVISDKTLPLPSGASTTGTLTVHPDGSSSGALNVTTRDGCTSLTLTPYGDLQEKPC